MAEKIPIPPKETHTGVLPQRRQKPGKELWRNNVLVHGLPKIGKTEFAGQWPNPCFAATEEGQGFLDIYEPVPCFDEIKKTKIGKDTYREEFVGVSGWEKFKTLIHDLSVLEHDFQTLVIDTADNLWLRCVKWHTVHHNVEYELDGVLGYNKGPSLILRDFNDTLTWACRLPMAVIFISHSMEKDFTVDGKKKTRVVTTLPPKAMQVVNAMVDMIIYITFKGEDRVIKTKAGPNYDAGSRIKGLPETIPFSYEALINAYTVATDGNQNAKKVLIERIQKGEQALASAAINGFEVEKRVHNSRAKHAGDKKLDNCGLKGLEAYLQHLQVKYQEGQKDGNGS